MSLDDIDREAMREGMAILKLRGFCGSRIRAKREKPAQVSDTIIKKAWKSMEKKK